MVFKKSYSLLIALVTVFPSCKDEIPDQPVEVKQGNVLIGNEGNFGWGDGTVSVYDPDTKEISEDAYKSINGEYPGNVLQSIQLIDSQFYLVLNNSQKIVVCNGSLSKMHEIGGFTSPRFIYKVAEDKAYVSDLYADKIWVVSLSLGQITGSIALSGWSEKMLIMDNEVWVCNVDRNQIYIINSSTDQIADSIRVGYFPIDLQLDNSDRIWVLCKGDGQNIKARLSILQAFNHSLVDSVVLTVTPSAFALVEDENVLYLSSDKLYELDLESKLITSFNSQVFQTPYAMGYDFQRKELYCSDVFDYTQRSSVFRFDLSGELIDEFKGGIITGSFHFGY